MHKKKILLLFTIIASLAFSVTGQTQSNKFEVGFNINQFHKDFGLGINLVSPYFFNSKVAVRASANFQWLEHLDATETTWTPYQNFQLGLRSRTDIIENRLYVYSEGGVILILPSSDFSSNDTEFGGYGLFGFELKPIDKLSYFIELGGVGTGATADLVTNKPIYSNGFFTNVGLRFRL